MSYTPIRSSSPLDIAQATYQSTINQATYDPSRHFSPQLPLKIQRPIDTYEPQIRVQQSPNSSKPNNHNPKSPSSHLGKTIDFFA